MPLKPRTAKMGRRSFLAACASRHYVDPVIAAAVEEGKSLRLGQLIPWSAQIEADEICKRGGDHAQFRGRIEIAPSRNGTLRDRAGGMPHNGRGTRAFLNTQPLAGIAPPEPAIEGEVMGRRFVETPSAFLA